MRKTDSDWKAHSRINSEFAQQRLPKNNSENKLVAANGNVQPDAPNKSKEQGYQPGSLYERAKEKMNHKQLFNNNMEKQKPRDNREFITPQPQPQPIPPGAPQRNSSKKPSMSYLLNESIDRGQRRVVTETSYNNYINPPVPEKKIGTYIRKPKNEPSDSNNSGNGSKLRHTLLKRVMGDEADNTADESRRFNDSRYTTTPANQRDYSLELYKKQMAKDKKNDFDSIKDNIKELKNRADSRSGSRSIGRSVGRQIDLSNDRINISKMLYPHRDNYE